MTISRCLPSKHAATVFSGLASKPVTTVFSILASKLVAMVSPGLASKLADGFLVEPQNQGGGGFPGLGLKITTTVSWFVPVYRLRYKTDRGRLAWDTHRDLAACFAWKQVWLGFPV
jgi:hypothetical protein